MSKMTVSNVMYVISTRVLTNRCRHLVESKLNQEKLFLLFSKNKILSVLRHPQDSPKETVLLLGMILIILFIILTLVALIAVKPKRKKQQPEKPIRKASVAAEILIVLMFVSLPCALIYTSQPKFCLGCHENSKEHQQLDASVHKEVHCLACHQEPGILGFITEKISRPNDSISFIEKSVTKRPRSPVRANVTNSSCNKCHTVDKRSLISHTIRVSHREILEAGYKCTDCHNTVAHNKAVPQPQYPTMEKCILCHDNKTASARCRLCHVPDVGKKPRQVMDYPKIHLEPPYDCRGCHDIVKCNACHGLEMPHPRDWNKKHPREGFANKQACWKCHDMKFCQECHSPMPWPHPDDFPSTHGKAAEQPGSCGCHKRRVFCALCHEDKE
jgi:nitrate/TMAO reductase-like tetraheme cytochrome c subunit